uniref:Prokineticin domain-containing protein n=1 Tax=Magallana gigas TaxID=29159 RepID=A0A8W8JTQ3_MAGGI|nr:uncharacterized protein LOC105337884 [Crassostrea gigas]|eukprot:XP_011441117.1 PREDICTED: uncharacterized protein LOC105337884 [Crassostrea gigas]
MRGLLICLGLVCILSVAWAATHCLTNAECGTDECCFKHDGPFLVSKRKRASSDLLGPAIHSSTGVCEKFKLEGEYCSWLDTANGHCGCQAGLQCRFVEDPNAHFEPFVVSKRGGVPGSIQCAQPLTTTAMP